MITQGRKLQSSRQPLPWAFRETAQLAGQYAVTAPVNIFSIIRLQAAMASLAQDLRTFGHDLKQSMTLHA